MKNQPLVSIIIPTYNRAHLISETINSIIAQTYKNWECIIVDDGSIDNTYEVVKDYIELDSRFSYHKRPINYKSGGNGARNYGYQISKGDFINWFDSDDLMHEEKIRSQVDQLLKNKDLDFSVCNTYIFENDKNQILYKRSENIYSNDNCFDYISMKNVFLTNAVLWRRSLIDKGYVFNESLKAAQEWEFNSKILLFNPEYLHINNCLVFNRKHNSSISYNVNTTFERKYNYIKARWFVLKFLKNNRIKNKKVEYYLKECMKQYSYDLIKLQAAKANLFNISYYRFLLIMSYMNKSITVFLRGCYWILKY